MIDYKEGHQGKTPELSEETKRAISFILNSEFYKCYDAAPRIFAVLLRDGKEEADFAIYTIPSGSHYWVKMGIDVFSTADMSNLRSSPIINDRTRELEQIAREHVRLDSPEAFDIWIYDKKEELQKEYLKTIKAIKTYGDKK